MPKLRMILCLLMTLALLNPAPVLAQSGTSKDKITPKSSLSTVFYMGAFGAILGLSTLSFTSEPSKHTKNILIGGAVGIIAGVGLVAYQAWTSPAFPGKNMRPAAPQKPYRSSPRYNSPYGENPYKKDGLTTVLAETKNPLQFSLKIPF